MTVSGLAHEEYPILDSFLRNEIEDGVDTVCIDLSGCQGMDNLHGHLVGYHKRLEDLSREGRAGRLVVVILAPPIASCWTWGLSALTGH